MKLARSDEMPSTQATAARVGSSHERTPEQQASHQSCRETDFSRVSDAAEFILG
jgi:hypothetical protein